MLSAETRAVRAQKRARKHERLKAGSLRWASPYPQRSGVAAMRRATSTSKEASEPASLLRLWVPKVLAGKRAEVRGFLLQHRARKGSKHRGQLGHAAEVRAVGGEHLRRRRTWGSGGEAEALAFGGPLDAREKGTRLFLHSVVFNHLRLSEG